MKLNIARQIQKVYDQSWLAQAFRSIESQVNAASEGRIVGAYNARTAAPTTGVWARGDEVRNIQPVETGTTGGMYVVRAWICVAGGEPGTWKEERTFTGN